ncbi:MAG: DUF2116 family Zn-ribbon domain-containing protein [Candidatus Ranarchaeia archaeon]
MTIRKKKASKYLAKGAGSQLWPHGHCKLCGEMIDDYSQEFCSDVCRLEYEYAQKKRKRTSLIVNAAFIAYFIIVIVVVFWSSGYFPSP